MVLCRNTEQQVLEAPTKLARNDRVAERNRSWLRSRGMLALNLVSSPGAGKTTLLDKTIRALQAQIPIRVVSGGCSR